MVAPRLFSLSTSRQLVPHASNNLIAALGDSRVDYAGEGYVADPVTNTLSPWNKMGQMQWWAEVASGGTIHFPPTMNFGLAGDTVTPTTGHPGMTSRVASVIASGAGACWFLGGTNDSKLATPIATTIAGVQSIIAQLRAAGIIVILGADMPRGNDAYSPNNVLTTSQRKNHIQYCQFIRSLHAPHNGIHVLDMWPEFSDPQSTAAWVALDKTYDGLHPQPRGSILTGQKFWDNFGYLWGGYTAGIASSAGDIYDATLTTRGNLVGTPGFMIGTSGTLGSATGTLPNGWSCTKVPGGTTLVGSAPTVNGKSDWMTLTGGGTYDGSSGQQPIVERSISTADIAAGDVLEGWYEFYCASGSVGVTGLRTEIQLITGGVEQNAVSGSLTSGTTFVGFLPQTAFSGIARFPRVTVQAGTTTFFKVRVMPEYRSTGGAVTLEYGVRAVTVRKVL